LEKRKQKAISNAAALGSAAISRGNYLPGLVVLRPEGNRRAGGGRNRGKPIARHRNTGARVVYVAQLFHGLRGRLMCYREHYVFARIGKCRCAECERDYNTAQAGKPSCSCHTQSVRLFSP
jgi:hypothetical protein